MQWRAGRETENGVWVCGVADSWPLWPMELSEGTDKPQQRAWRGSLVSVLDDFSYPSRADRL